MFLPAKVPNVSENNPLLQPYDLPPFSAIRPEHVQPAIEQILADNRAGIQAILKDQGQNPTWAGLVLAMDELNDRLGAAWSPVSHLNAVCNSAELREAYEACLPALSAYSTEMGQNRELFQAFEALAHSPQVADFDQAQKPFWNTRCVTSVCRVSTCQRLSKSVMPKSRANCPSWAASSPTSCWTPPRPGPNTSPTKLRWRA
jgi:Zn-dependent oligopeptidases